MPKKVLIGLIACMVLWAVMLGAVVGCEKPNIPENTNVSLSLSRFENIKTVEYDGHEYVVYNSGVGSSITHKENCKFDR